MIRGRGAPALRPRGPAGRWQDERTLLHLAIAQHPLPVQELELPIEPLFGLQRLGALARPPAVDQVELRRVAQGVIGAQRMCRALREDAPERSP